MAIYQQICKLISSKETIQPWVELINIMIIIFTNTVVHNNSMIVLYYMMSSVTMIYML